MKDQLNDTIYIFALYMEKYKNEIVPWWTQKHWRNINNTYTVFMGDRKYAFHKVDANLLWITKRARPN